LQTRKGYQEEKEVANKERLSGRKIGCKQGKVIRKKNRLQTRKS
jgi:hypothetical protein